MVSMAGIIVSPQEGEELNGLGMMMLQFLEQNLADFAYKVTQGQKIRGSFTVEMDGGVASTMTFEGHRILITNGVPEKPDLYMRGSYLSMTKVLAGQSNPVMEILRRNIKLAAFPRRPIQCLKLMSFLKIPKELPNKGNGLADEI